MSAKLLAEFIGTFWLVLGGCGAAVLAATFPELGIGFTGVSLAFGLTVLTAAYALGPISGGHFNPAVSLGLCVGGRFPAAHLLPYCVAQVGGAIVAAAVLFVIASGRAGFDPSAGFASNGFGSLSPGQYGMGAAIVTEVVMTFMFLIVILGVTHRARTGGIRRRGDRTCPDAHPSRQHSGDEHVGESGPQHRARALRGDGLHPAALAVLARSAGGCGAGRPRPPDAARARARAADRRSSGARILTTRDGNEDASLCTRRSGCACRSAAFRHQRRQCWSARSTTR